MSFRGNTIRAANYLDNNGTALVKAGTNTAVAVDPSGSFTVSSTGSGKYVVGLIVTTNSSSTVTVNISAYAFASIPVVTVTPVGVPPAGQVYVASVTSVSTTAVIIKTFVSQNTGVLIGGTIVPFTTAPTVTVHMQLIQQ